MTVRSVFSPFVRLAAVVAFALMGCIGLAAPAGSTVSTPSAAVTLDAVDQQDPAQGEAGSTDLSGDDQDTSESTPDGVAALALVIAVTALIVSGIAVIISLRRPAPAAAAHDEA